AIECDARAHQVTKEITAQEDAGGVADAGIDAEEEAAHLLECIELLLAHGVAGDVGASQMRHDEDRRQSAGQGVFFGELPRVLRRETETVYAGLQMKRAGAGHVTIPAISFPDGDIAWRIEDRNEAGLAI